jgi:RhoGEF domain
MIASFSFFEAPEKLFFKWLLAFINVEDVTGSPDRMLIHVLDSKCITMTEKWLLVACLLEKFRINVLNIVIGCENSVIQMAITADLDLNIFKLLLSYSPMGLHNVIDANGNTILHQMVKYNQIEHAFTLMCKVASTSPKKNSHLQQLLLAKNKKGQTALFIACELKNSKMAHLLLMAKKSIAAKMVEIADESGITPLMITMCSKVNERFDCRNNASVSDSLFRALVKANSKSALFQVDSWKQSAVHKAAIYDNSLLLNIIFNSVSLDQWEKVMLERDCFNKTAILHALENENHELSQMLLDKISSNSMLLESVQSFVEKLKGFSIHSLKNMIPSFMNSPPKGGSPPDKEKRGSSNGAGEGISSMVFKRRGSNAGIQINRACAVDNRSAPNFNIGVVHALFSHNIVVASLLQQAQEQVSHPVVKEILSTENTLNQSLFNLEIKFMNPTSLVNTCESGIRVFSLKKYYKLFGHVHMVKRISDLFISNIEAHKDSLHSICNSLHNITWLAKLYRKFILHYSEAETVLHNLSTSNALFGIIKEIASESVQGKTMNELASLMMAPVQRLPSLLLLLKTLQEALINKYCEKFENGLIQACENISNAITKLKTSLDDINQEKRNCNFHWDGI